MTWLWLLGGLVVLVIGGELLVQNASLTAAIKGDSALSIGNLVGSNILNIFLVLGATAEVGTLSVAEVVPEHDVWWMIGAAVLLAPLILLGKGKIGSGAGAAYVAVYVAYVILVVGHG